MDRLCLDLSSLWAGAIKETVGKVSLELGFERQEGLGKVRKMEAVPG